MENKLQWIVFLLRVGIFGTFLGHGVFAFNGNEKWIYLITHYGFSKDFAVFIMPYIGVMDIIVAFIILIYPVQIIIKWAIFWAFATALSRPLAGDPIWEFVERAANWVAPAILLTLLPVKENKTISEIIKIIMKRFKSQELTGHFSSSQLK